MSLTKIFVIFCRLFSSDKVAETVTSKSSVIRAFQCSASGTFSNLSIGCREAESQSDMVIYDLQVVSYLLRVETENYQLSIYEFRVTVQKLQIYFPSWKLLFMGCKLWLHLIFRRPSTTQIFLKFTNHSEQVCLKQISVFKTNQNLKNIIQWMYLAGKLTLQELQELTACLLSKSFVNF